MQWLYVEHEGTTGEGAMRGGKNFTQSEKMLASIQAISARTIAFHFTFYRAVCSRSIELASRNILLRHEHNALPTWSNDSYVNYFMGEPFHQIHREDFCSVLDSPHLIQYCI